jgi:hypothetical protein
MSEPEDFQEIGHCGGQFIVTAKTAPDGQRRVSFGVRHSTPRPASFFAVYALPPGFPVDTIQLGGIGDKWNTPPHPSCLPVFIASDVRSMFGHECPVCGGYWRSPAVPSFWPTTCPYCGRREGTHAFLTKGQRRFVEAMCALTEEAIQSDKDDDFVIDMDKVADDVQRTGERPNFYYTETSQQNHFKCAACGEANDILGTYGYCGCCGTRNDLQELTRTIERIQDATRARRIAKEPMEPAISDAVGAFDSVARQYAKQLAKRVPMIPARRTALESALFHSPKARADELKAWFGINLLDGLDPDAQAFIIRMFLRRHVYEHNGGQVDQKYLDESGDTSVKLGQALRETPQSIFRLTPLILKMAQNLHEGFHELFPPVAQPIEYETERKARREAYRQGR